MSGDLAAAVRDGDERALARAITVLENHGEGYRDLVADLYPAGGRARVVGVTGSPGAGKSTLVDSLVGTLSERGERVAVLAVDPASPFSGGAVLGDRVRMHGADAFVRSMSARGAAGGLAAATADAVTALDAAGFDWVLVETVGAGQSEVDVVRVADTVAVLVPPDSGDDVQMLKAGILEIADVFVVNKADLDGADRTVRELRRVVERRTGDWDPPVVETVATTGEGVSALLNALTSHRDAADDQHRARHLAAVRAALDRAVDEQVRETVAAAGGVEALADRVAAGDGDPASVVESVLEGPTERRRQP